MLDINVLVNEVTHEYISCNEPNKIIEVYSNQKKSDWMELPANKHKGFVSPFHMTIECQKDELIQSLNKVNKIITSLFNLNNSSCIVLQQSRKQIYRVIYPELLLSALNELRLIVTIKQYVKVGKDKCTYLPNSGKYKTIGVYNDGQITDDDTSCLTSLNGIQFSQVLGQINYTVNKTETSMKQHSS